MKIKDRMKEGKLCEGVKRKMNKKERKKERKKIL